MSEVPTVGRLLAEARNRLRAAGIESAALDARLLAAHAFGRSPEALIRDEAMPVPPGERCRFSGQVARRARGEPVAYITGGREFWSLDLAVGPGCLVPRPDSEALVAASLEALGTRTAGSRILDLGTGSGCLLLALLSEMTSAWGTGIDANEHALRTARANAVRLGLDGRAMFLRGDWAAAVNGPFDLVVANPPYIPSADIEGLPRDIRDFEPRAALDGGPDGLGAIRVILAQTVNLLAPRGLAAIEFGPGQAEAVERLGVDLAGLRTRRFIPDLAGRTRGILLERGAA